MTQKTNSKAKPFQHMGVTIYWTGVRVCKAQYKGLDLEIRGNGGVSRSIFIDGRKAHSGESIDDLKRWISEYFKGM